MHVRENSVVDAVAPSRRSPEQRQPHECRERQPPVDQQQDDGRQHRLDQGAHYLLRHVLEVDEGGVGGHGCPDPAGLEPLDQTQRHPPQPVEDGQLQVRLRAGRERPYEPVHPHRGQQPQHECHRQQDRHGPHEARIEQDGAERFRTDAARADESRLRQCPDRREHHDDDRDERCAAQQRLGHHARQPAREQWPPRVPVQRPPLPGEAHPSQPRPHDRSRIPVAEAVAG